MDFQQWWSQAAAAFQSLNPQAAAPMPGMGQLPDLSHLMGGASAEALAGIQQRYVQQLQALLSQGMQASPIPDRRFAAPAWTQNAFANQVAQLYLLNAKTLLELADCVQADAKTKARIRFAVEQAVSAASPANSLALNPSAQAKVIETQGKSIAQGMQNLLADMAQGHLSQTDESQFEVGRNVGTSVGAVVFENPLFQLIEYKPSTPQVHARPLLIIPPCINKFYILDLQPANSLVAYAVAQGHRTFVLSWRNPQDDLAHATWDDYIEDAAICAIQTVQRLCKADQINALGFCVGGTILATALAVLAARRKAKDKSPVASATFLTTLMDFSNTGVLDLFIDEQHVAMREQQFAKGGLLKGQELATTFSFLRPDDLVWNYVQSNYLLGQTPPPFDLLYWNSDSTNLPGPMFAWYLRHTYLQNQLCKPGSLTVCGQNIDLGRIREPAYVYGSKEDHIVPIDAAYASLKHLGGSARFVMGASGHIAGVVNPPAANKRSHWLGTAPKKGAAMPNFKQWQASATEHPGSWWPDWAAWLAGHAGALKAAPRTYCAKAIEPAPGRYVKAKA